MGRNAKQWVTSIALFEAAWIAGPFLFPAPLLARLLYFVGLIFAVNRVVEG